MSEREGTAGRRQGAVQGSKPNDSRVRPIGRVVALGVRQGQEFGGLNWGAAFFGWLVAIGMAAILTAIPAAAGAAIGVTSITSSDAKKSASTIGVGGGIALLLVLLLAYYAGGYVAGRMSPFDGDRQGFGVWAFGLIITILFAVAGALFGSEYNVLRALHLPRVPVKEGGLATGGAIALVAIVLGTLTTAIVGGRVGRGYHRRVDRAGYPA